MILDTTSKTVQLVLGEGISASQCDITASYADISGTTFTPGSNDLVSNGTTLVTVVASPASSTQRVVKEITVVNRDSITHTVTLQLYDGTNTRQFQTSSVAAGATVRYCMDAQPPSTGGGSSYITSTDSNFTVTGGGELELNATAVTAGSYTLSDITVDANGRITAASNGSAPSGYITSVDSNFTVTSAELKLDTTAVTAGSYTLADITVDAYGRITAASNGSAPTGYITAVDSNFAVSGTTLELATIASGDVLGNSGSSTAEPAAATLTALLDRAFGSTEGNILQRGSSAWQVLAPGTAGTYLASGGASALNSWSTPAGTGITALTGDVTASGTGSVAATLATVNSNVGSYTNANITVNAKGLITAAANGSAGSGANYAPGGRLSLSSGVAVQTADVVAGTTVYYVPYVHDQLPVVGLTLGSGVSLALDSNSGHTGYQQSGKLFDLFLYDSSGTLKLGTGPAWTSLTARSAAIDQTTVAGIWTNTSTMTLKTDATSSTISAAAGSCVYVGTMYAVGNGTCTNQFNPTPATGGTNTIIGLFNAYNRGARTAVSIPSDASWTYATATWRNTNASASNRVSWVDGLAVISALATENQTMECVSGFRIGVGFNTSGSTTPINTPSSNEGSAVTSFEEMSTTICTPTLGFNFVQEQENAVSSVTATLYGYNNPGYLNILTWTGEH